MVGASLVDVAIAVPHEYLTDFQLKFFNYHLEYNNDFLIKASPLWLRTFVWIEVFFQVPFFFVAIYWLIRGQRKTAYPWILVYVIECVTTTIGSIAGIFDIEGPTREEKINLALIYVSALVPLVFGVKVFNDIRKWIQFDPVKKNQ